MTKDEATRHSQRLAWDAQAAAQHAWPVRSPQLHVAPMCKCGKLMTLASDMNFFWLCAGERVGDTGCGTRKPL